MKTSRRSFLSAVLGAAAAPAVLGGVPVAPGPVTSPFSSDLSPASRALFHYSIIESVELLPGEVLSESLFVPPWPAVFVVSSIGVNLSALEFPRPGRFDTLLDFLFFEIRTSPHIPYFEVPAGYLGPNLLLAAPMLFKGSMGPSITLHSGGRPIPRELLPGGLPMRVEVILSGVTSR